MARPTKLNEELIKNMAAEIAEGTPKCYVCDLFGIHESTFDLWMTKGEEDLLNEIDSLYSSLWTAIKKSHAEHIIKARKRIQKGEPGWQGTAWWLERTNVKFMPKQQIQADDDGKVTVVIGGKQKLQNANNK